MTTPVNIGERRELLVDDALIESIKGEAELALHRPVRREIALVADQPWEGNMCGGGTVLRDGDRLRLYYKTWDVDLAATTPGAGEGLAETHGFHICLAESSDGLEWTRLKVGAIEFEGSKDNNIVWTGEGEKRKGIHGFAPFKDSNPDCPTDQRYKAVGSERKAMKGDLWTMVSPDGIHWRLASENPIVKNEKRGGLDSQNLAFWDAVNEEYRLYFRMYDAREPDQPRIRAIKTATSKDFLHWSEAEWLEYPGAPREQLYTNKITPYPRAPHIVVGFPTRYVQRKWSKSTELMTEPEHRRLRSGINERFGAALTDALFMSSRDRKTFKRWGEAFFVPGPQTRGNWCYGDNFPCWGMFETPSPIEDAPDEYSFLTTENRWRDVTRLRRHSIRKDGFVSMRAKLSGGEFTTVPLIFEGSELEINVATSAAGSVRVEIQDTDGAPLPGFALDDTVENVGDELNRIVHWENGPNVSSLVGKPIRLRFVMSDADLFSYKFNSTP